MDSELTTFIDGSILGDRGFSAMPVRSDRVTLLTPVVQTNPGMSGQ
ncbi:hypothetical protein [Leptolyngbya sp. FACHB-17]|nr:hypothetical protein [Leptolyngbya sp. FACHB-17]MBD2081176.1 hypothetical protein [Leptolyngbya sp. FACHB-17]